MKTGSRSSEKKTSENRLMGIYQVQKHTVVASAMLSSGYRVPCTLHLSTVRKSPVCKQTKTQDRKRVRVRVRGKRQDSGINEGLMHSHS